jgi:hypothetical protein
MAEFSDAELEKKLSELRDSQKEIQALSSWLVNHRWKAAWFITGFSNVVHGAEQDLVMWLNRSGFSDVAQQGWI